METKICNSCRYENSYRNNFCTQCGSKLLEDVQNLPRLCILYGEPKGALFLLRKGRTTIGHDCGNLIVLGDELISNKHASIIFKEEDYWIEDRNSKNGVFVNGDKISRPERLTNGSVIKMGSTILRFEDTNGN